MGKMLKLVGANSLDDLIKKTVPEEILLKDKLKINNPTSEHESMKEIKAISEKNKLYNFGISKIEYLEKLYAKCYRKKYIL